MPENKRLWTKEEENYLKSNCHLPCYIIAEYLNRTTKSVQHKFNELELEKPKAKTGDIINGWEILEIYSKNIGSQNIKMAKIKSTIENEIERNVRLTILTKNKIGLPGRPRPDLSQKNTTHGLSGTRLHRIWCGMKSRCYNSKQKHYSRYGGRGIIVCDEWRDSFIKFKEWADLNGYSDSLTIDRIDNNKNYSPENCRWSTYKVQNNNKKKPKHLFEWLRKKYPNILEEYYNE